MDKTIEKNFFRMFSKGGAATLGLEYLEFKVNDDGYDAEESDRRYRKYCTEEIPIKIKELTEAFDDSIFDFYDGERPAIMTEIENNLDNCSNEYEKESYLHSLLTPLKHWANAFNNTPFINAVNRLTNGIKQDLLETCHDPETLEKRMKEADETHKKIIEGSEKHCRELSQSFSPWSEDGTPESYCAYWEELVRDYAYMLDAILLERRIDLFKLQKDCGVWLIEERAATLLYPYLETVERGEYLIEALQKEIEQTDVQDEKQEPQQEAKPQSIPTINDTDKERFVFDNALQKQYMTLNGGGGINGIELKAC